MPLSSIRVKKTAPTPEISDQIGRQLRTVYNDVLSQPVPDRFLDLLKDLDAFSDANAHIPACQDGKKAAK